jgi:hypothetical protein
LRRGIAPHGIHEKRQVAGREQVGGSVSLHLVTAGQGQESDVFVGLDAFRNDVGLHAMPTQ